MLPLLTLFFTSFCIAFSGALMPGPLLTVTISETAWRGLLVGPLLIIGHSILELILVVILLLGLAPLITNDLVITVVGVFGGVIMLWMAVSMFRSLPSLTIKWNAQEKARGNLIVTGALMSLANPYWTIWWATIGLGYILHSKESGFVGVCFFFVGHILADFVWYTLISVSIGKGRHLLNDVVYRIIIGICAGMLVFFAFFLSFGVVYRTF
jgi:threonine/homoserine/homoserine lactone efflux protein